MNSLFSLLLSIFFTISYASTAPLPLLSLLSLKSSLHDPLLTLRNWTYASIENYSSPTLDPPWCYWPGITCDSITGEVISLDLSNRNLSGTIAPELRLLSRTLTHLNISRNNFTGSLPSVIFDLRNLVSLDISHNNFNSTFPSTISNLNLLNTLNAYSNCFTGSIPDTTFNLTNLQYLNFGGSFFNGSIPPEISSMPQLRYLHLAGNLLTGNLPDQIGELSLLEHLEIGYNNFYGDIPVSFGLLSKLQYLDISSANLSGPLTLELGKLKLLESLFLFKNQFTGTIPEEFSNLKALKVLDLSDNKLNGSIPDHLVELANLTLINLMSNRLTGSIPVGFGDLENLEVLNLWNNSLTGQLPLHLGLKQRLERLDVSTNFLTGPIPPNLCAGNRLVRLILFSNRFTSVIPNSLKNCSTLWRMRVEKNRLTGPIPAGFGSLRNLTYMDLSQNLLSGSMPSDLFVSNSLEYLNVTGNPLGGLLPVSIWNSPRLEVLSASYCLLEGEMPNFESGCRNIYKIEMEGNRLIGNIPIDITQCNKLLSIKLDRNRLSGAIPLGLASLPSITELNLSWNGLTGSIPFEFSNCTTLESFDVSYNRLTGPVPWSGPVLKNMQPWVLLGNPGLCGEAVGKPCPSNSEGEKIVAKGSAGAAIMWVAAVVVAVAGIVVLALGTRFAQQKAEMNEKGGVEPWNMMAFQKLSFTAEDVAKCAAGTEGIIGVGSTGTVYRAKMPCGDVIAVKKLWQPKKEEDCAAKREVKVIDGQNIMAEVEVLGSIRHRNIVRLLGWCNNSNTTMLLYEYMPNGSLEELLHGGGEKKGAKVVIDWETRYKIAVGVAQGLSYLHHDCRPVVVHRDLKPSNILLDADMEARVADFGVAKIINGADQYMSVIAGSCGYIAPEYAYTLQVDEKSDVYSYGVVLLEILTGRRSVEAEYGEGNSIVDWVRSKIQRAADGRAWEVLDPTAGVQCTEVRKEMTLMLRVALLCTSKSPDDRPSMRDVLLMLQEAKPHRKQADGCNRSGVGAAGDIKQKPVVDC
ncbi:Leucine-rich repeat receptor-like protein kinase family protein [Rhynchospora pubera]|uniref:Leucine-rich repeat receptor-like protein kinase family protein n=1 Tax=Rhynchospora pubera TaxID=906938 RepID=A0AAV8E6R7_9POAL|nr:Leucine-rich repeat receptor-like protein kinase family protein [Rhynchospora pubera]